MVRLPSACFALVLTVLAAALVTAQVPQPAAEPGSVPEHQTAPMQSGPGGSVRPSGPVRISGGVEAGLRLSGDQPVYPSDAKAQGISGSVVMRALVGKDGHVLSLTVVSGNELLATAALDAVKTWVYKPYLLNGEPTEVDTTVTVNFSLSGSL